MPVDSTTGAAATAATFDAVAFAQASRLMCFAPASRVQVITSPALM
jgi:hypothetical protein